MTKKGSIATVLFVLIVGIVGAVFLYGGGSSETGAMLLENGEPSEPPTTTVTTPTTSTTTPEKQLTCTAKAHCKAERLCLEKVGLGSKKIACKEAENKGYVSADRCPCPDSANLKDDCDHLLKESDSVENLKKIVLGTANCDDCDITKYNNGGIVTSCTLSEIKADCDTDCP